MGRCHKGQRCNYIHPFNNHRCSDAFSVATAERKLKRVVEDDIKDSNVRKGDRRFDGETRERRRYGKRYYHGKRTGLSPCKKSRKDEEGVDGHRDKKQEKHNDKYKKKSRKTSKSRPKEKKSKKRKKD